jgi:hypothetical protein
VLSAGGTYANRPALNSAEMKYSREVIGFNYGGVACCVLWQKAVWEVAERRGLETRTPAYALHFLRPGALRAGISAVQVGFGWKRLS